MTKYERKLAKRNAKIARKKAKAVKRSSRLAMKAKKRTFGAPKPSPKKASSGVRTGGSTSSRYNRSARGSRTSMVRRGGVFGRR